MAEGGVELVVRVLGPLEVEVAGRPVTVIGRVRALLAVLALSPGRPVSIERITRALWGDAPPVNARRSIHTNVARLRAALGSVMIARTDTGYRLRAGAESVDAARFVALLDGRSADPATDRDQLSEALGLWRGSPFDGVESDWLVRTEAPHLIERYLAAVERRADLDLADRDKADRDLADRDQADRDQAEGGRSELVAELSELVAQYPLRESLWVRLLRALQWSGRPAEALARYETIRVRLAEELGAAPGSELRQVHADLLAGESTAQPEPDVPPGQVVPRQLPASIYGFVGRSDALKALYDLSAGTGQPAGTVVITAIAGTAGVGKTALAVHWAHQIADRFPDGQLYINLRGYDPTERTVDPRSAVRGFLDALGVPPARLPRDPDAQAGLYRSLLAGKRMLVLLDNARTADQVRPLLPGSPGSLVIVTSRDRLAGLIALDAARPVVLDPLPVDEARQLVTHRFGADRVAADQAATDEIIATCARLPLALAIATARAAVQPTLPLAELARQLRDERFRLDALTTGDPATDVRAVFSWSLQTVSSEGARLFRLLGLHPAPDLAVPAAASLAGIPIPQARRLLAELAKAHLVTEHLSGRYTFHDLLRAYAVGLTHAHDPGPVRHAARHRMLDHYLHTAHAAALLLDPYRPPLRLASRQPGVALAEFADHRQAMSWFTTEHAVLLNAVANAAGTGFGVHAWQLAWTLQDGFDRRGRWQEWADAQRIALDAAERLGEPVGRAHTHRGLGLAYNWLRRYEAAEAHLRRALELFTQDGDVVGQARAHLGLSLVLGRSGRHTDALYHGEHAAELSRIGGDQRGEASALNYVAWEHIELGDYRQAVRSGRQAIDVDRQLGSRFGEAATWDTVGYAYHHLGQYDRAIECLYRAIDQLRELGSRYAETEALTHLGDSQLAAGDPDAARAAWRAALTILEDLDHPDAGEIRSRLAGLG